MKKTFSVLIALALALALSFIVTAPVAADPGTTYYVTTTGSDETGDGSWHDPWETIQYAIGQVASGDTIEVGPGTYVEDLVIPAGKDGLELKGSGANVTTIKAVATADHSSSEPPVYNIRFDEFDGVSGVKIHGFTIESPDVSTNHYASGMVLNGQDIEIYDNNFVSKGAESAENNYCVAIQTWRWSAAPDSDITGLKIYNNTFSSEGDLWVYQGVFVNRDGEDFGDVTVSGNTFSGNVHLGIAYEGNNAVINDNEMTSTYEGVGIAVMDWAEGAQNDVEVDGNELQGFDSGAIIGRGDQVVTNVTVVNNAFSDNRYQVRDRADALNLEDVLTNNDFDRAVVVRGSGIKVPTIFSSIQDAIDAADPGDTVEVAAGTYEEQLLVNKDLSLVGEEGAVIQAPDTLVGYTQEERTGTPYYPVVFAFGGTLDGTQVNGDEMIQFDMSGFTIDGQEYDERNSVGIRLRNVEGTISGNELGNFVLTTESAGILSLGAADLTIEDNTISHFGRTGIQMYGLGPSADATISSNTITGISPTTWALNGIAAGMGATGTIESNTITDITHSSELSTAIGIWGGSNYVVKDNTVTDSDGGFAVYSYWDTYPTDNNLVEGNSISNCLEGITLGAAAHDATNNTITDNTIDGTDRGVYIVGSYSLAGTETHLNEFNDNAIQVEDDSDEGLDLESILAENTFDRAVVVRGSGIKVPVIFSSIQDAIDAASAGDTIEVAAGTYDEVVVIDKADLTVQAGSRPLIQPTSTGSWPNYGAVNIRADGVTFDGFEVDASLAPQNGINAYGVSDIIISDNVVHGADHTWDGMGIAVWDWTSSSTVDNALIENNEVYDTGRMGIFCMDYDTTNSEYDLTEGHTIRGNTVYNTWKKGNDWSDAGGGIQINAGKDCAITDNTIYDTTSSNLSDCYNPCVYMFGSGTGNNITGNTMRDSDAGITLWISGEGGSAIDWEGDTATSPEVHYNNIYNNTYYGACSINVAGTPMVMDATANWWGDASGPYHATTNPSGTGNDASDNVDYSPWWGANYIGVGHPWEWYTNDSIQDAIDAASAGDTVNVLAGTYDEQVTIDKSLTVIGAGKDQTFLKAAGSPVVNVSADNVTIQDLEITDDTELAEGIRVVSGASTGLTVERVDFTELGAGTGANAYGIRVTTSFTDLSVSDCDFVAVDHTTNYRTIGVFAPNSLQLGDFAVSDSTFQKIWTGIYLRSAIDGLDVIGSTFGPVQSSDFAACVSGIYIGDGDDDNFDIENVVISDNAFTEYGRGVYVWNYANNGTVSNFEIYGNNFTNSVWSSGIRFIAGLGDDEEVSFDGVNVHDNVFTQNSTVGAHVALVDFRTYCELAYCDIDVTDNEATLSGGPYTDPWTGIALTAWEGPFTNTLIDGNVLNGGDCGGTGTPPSTGILLRHKSSEYWPSGALEMDITNNDITAFDHGVGIYDDVAVQYGGLPTGSDVDINYNKIYGNALYGVVNGNSELVDATYNWWGDATGPYHDILNPRGEGNEVSDNVLFDPWYGDEGMTTLVSHSTYKFVYDVPDPVVATEETLIPVTFATDVLGQVGYDGIRFKFSASGPGDVVFKATDSTNTTYTFTNSGYWGPSAGFNLTADYSATTDWSLNFTEPGDYTITFSLIVAPDGEVIAGIEGSQEVTVRAVDICDYYRRLHGADDEVDTLDLLAAADDWSAYVVPPGFDEPITTARLLQLADEWYAAGS